MEPYRDGSESIRVSDAEREAAVQRLQVAFAEGRLTGEEFDGRMRSALVARTQGDLASLATDLPEGAPAVAAAGAPGATSGRMIAYKNSVHRNGRWRVPEHLRVVIYKGGAVIDLRAAELTGPVTNVVAYAYKSNVEIIVPPGVRVESGGIGVSHTTDGASLTAEGPLVHVKGIAYKGGIDVTALPRP